VEEEPQWQDWQRESQFEEQLVKELAHNSYELRRMRRGILVYQILGVALLAAGVATVSLLYFDSDWTSNVPEMVCAGFAVIVSLIILRRVKSLRRGHNKNKMKLKQVQMAAKARYEQKNE